MLSIYRLILNYNFVSFLVFYSHFYVSFIYFSCRLQKPWKCTKEAEKSQMDAVRWVKAGSTCCSEFQSHYSENHSRCNECQFRCSEVPQDQMETRAKIQGPDLLEHETLDIKEGSNNHFRGGEIEDDQGLFLERETLRKPLFLEDSYNNWRIKAKNPSLG